MDFLNLQHVTQNSFLRNEATELDAYGLELEGSEFEECVDPAHEEPSLTGVCDLGVPMKPKLDAECITEKDAASLGPHFSGDPGIDVDLELQLSAVAGQRNPIGEGDYRSCAGAELNALFDKEIIAPVGSLQILTATPTSSLTAGVDPEQRQIENVSGSGGSTEVGARDLKPRMVPEVGEAPLAHVEKLRADSLPSNSGDQVVSMMQSRMSGGTIEVKSGEVGDCSEQDLNREISKFYHPQSFNRYIIQGVEVEARGGTGGSEEVGSKDIKKLPMVSHKDRQQVPDQVGQNPALELLHDEDIEFRGDARGGISIGRLGHDAFSRLSFEGQREDRKYVGSQPLLDLPRLQQSPPVGIAFPRFEQIEVSWDTKTPLADGTFLSERVTDRDAYHISLPFSGYSVDDRGADAKLISASEKYWFGSGNGVGNISNISRILKEDLGTTSGAIPLIGSIGPNENELFFGSYLISDSKSSLEISRSELAACLGAFDSVEWRESDSGAIRLMLSKSGGDGVVIEFRDVEVYEAALRNLDYISREMKSLGAGFGFVDVSLKNPEGNSQGQRSRRASLVDSRGADGVELFGGRRLELESISSRAPYIDGLNITL